MFCFLLSDVAAIDPEWLPLFAKGLCNLSEPLDDPPPFYDKHDDSVKCYVTGTYGPYCWPIPMTAIQFPAGHELHTKWFARLLVEGHIHSFFQKYASRLLVPPSLVIRPWAKHNPKTSAIINCLKRERVGTLATLNSKWISEPTCKDTSFFVTFFYILLNQICSMNISDGSLILYTMR